MLDAKLEINDNNHAEFVYLRYMAPQLDAAARGMPRAEVKNKSQLSSVCRHGDAPISGNMQRKRTNPAWLLSFISSLTSNIWKL